MKNFCLLVGMVVLSGCWGGSSKDLEAELKATKAELAKKAEREAIISDAVKEAAKTPPVLTQEEAELKTITSFAGAPGGSIIPQGSLKKLGIWGATGEAATQLAKGFADENRDAAKDMLRKAEMAHEAAMENFRAQRDAAVEKFRADRDAATDERHAETKALRQQVSSFTGENAKLLAKLEKLEAARTDLEARAEAARGVNARVYSALCAQIRGKDAQISATNAELAAEKARREALERVPAPPVPTSVFIPDPAPAAAPVYCPSGRCRR